MKQFCLRGHDTFICGRTKDRLCIECGRLLVGRWSKKYPEKRNAGTKRLRLIRRQQIDSFKDKPCMDCGVQYPPYVMQFDHKNPKEKTRNIAAWTTYSFEGLLAEIKKCELVCANCHAVRTHNRLVASAAANLNPVQTLHMPGGK